MSAIDRVTVSMALARPSVAQEIKTVKEEKASVEEARNELIAFIKSKAFESLSVPLSTFQDALKSMSQSLFRHRNKEDVLFSRLGILFSQIIQQAEKSNLISKSVGKAFFADNFDQRSFVTGVATEVIKYAHQQKGKIGKKAVQIKKLPPKAAIEVSGLFKPGLCSTKMTHK